MKIYYGNIFEFVNHMREYYYKRKGEIVMRKTNVSGIILHLARKMYKLKIPILPKVLKNINRIIFSCDIPYTANLDKTVILGHNGLGTVINSNAEIGKKTLIMQNVTIGGNMGKFRIENGKSITAPKIGNNVIIGANSVILGPILIGDYVQIGAGAVVTKDIPNNSVVVGIPGKVVKILTDQEAQEAYSKI